MHKAFIACCLLLATTATVCSADLVESSQQGLDATPLAPVRYRGVLLKRYRTSEGKEIVEPYVSFDLRKKPEIRRNILGKGFYFQLPLSVQSSSIKRHRKNSKILKLDAFRVQLRKAFSSSWCSRGCSEVAAGGFKDAAGRFNILFRCKRRAVCMRVFEALYFKNADSDLVASAFSFSFSGVAAGSRFALKKTGLPVRKAATMPLKDAFWFEGNKVLLYTIKAGSGQSAHKSFMKDLGYRLPADGSWPDVYRSALLNNLKAAVASSGQWKMVAEMRKGGKLLAQVVFDVQKNRNSLNINNWFSPDRIVSSYPYFLPKTGYNYFNIAGNWQIERRFFINFRYGGCPHDAGFWTVSDRRDPCPWSNRGWKGRGPVLVFNTVPGKSYQSGRVEYADQFLVYLRYSIPALAPRIENPYRNDFEFEKGKLLLYTIRANSNIKAYHSFMTVKSYMIPRDNSLPTVYRSGFLDNLPAALSTNSKRRIVAEMQTGGRVVAKVVFDASDNKVNKLNWFSKSRIISSFPTALRRNNHFNFFSVAGHKVGSHERRFFISFSYGGCPRDFAFWSVLDTRERCPWGGKWWQGSFPTLVYSVKTSDPMISSGRRADRFLVYMI